MPLNLAEIYVFVIKILCEIFFSLLCDEHGKKYGNVCERIVKIFMINCVTDVFRIYTTVLVGHHSGLPLLVWFANMEEF